METLILTRKNHSVSELKIEKGTKKEVAFVSEKGAQIAELIIDREFDGKYILSNIDSQDKGLVKSAMKYLSVEYKSEIAFDERYKYIQGWAKNVAKKLHGEQTEAKPEAEARPEVVESSEVTRKKEFKPKSEPKVGLEAQIFKMIEDGINDESTTEIIIDKTRQFLDENGIVPNRTEISVKNIAGEVKHVGVQHYLFEDILATISARVPLALVGPAGSGKTTTVKNVADSLSLEFFAKSVSAQTGQHEFFGYQDANGNYVKTLFREAYENGGVFLLDEFDAGNPNVLAALNQATANGETAFADGMVKKHEDFIIVMAGNTFGHGATTDYVGRNRIDAATLDRFAFIYFDYDEKLESIVAGNQDWTKKVQKIRKEVAKKKIKTIISPRASINGAKLLKAGLSEKRVIDLVITKGLSKDEISLLKDVL